jgi:hypothetical protein
MFSAGIASPLDIGLDIAVCGLLTFLLGWHYGFLPSFVLEVVPLLDLIPTWSLAVLIVVRRARAQAGASDVPPFISPPLSHQRKPPPPVIDI